MLITLALMASVTALAGHPEMPSLQPVTRSGQLLQALDKAEDDFASVKSELGLVGSAPMPGLKAEEPVRSAAAPSAKASVQRASTKTRRR